MRTSVIGMEGGRPLTIGCPLDTSEVAEGVEVSRRLREEEDGERLFVHLRGTTELSDRRADLPRLPRLNSVIWNVADLA
jgi:hypothetical protein